VLVVVKKQETNPWTVKTQKEVAAFFDVWNTKIQNWIAKGMPGTRGSSLKLILVGRDRIKDLNPYSRNYPK
jgi:hypothetical protein